MTLKSLHLFSYPVDPILMNRTKLRTGTVYPDEQKLTILVKSVADSGQIPADKRTTHYAPFSSVTRSLLNFFEDADISVKYRKDNAATHHKI